ncbi:ComF family protein [Virgibacillus halophilus]
MNWENLFLPRTMNGLCSQCENGMEKITGQRCRYCSRMSPDTVCRDCILWQRKFDGDDPLTENYAIFTYGELMQAMIAKWKYRGDYAVGHAFRYAFLQGFQKKFGKCKDFVAVPIPLSADRYKERGFNQAQMLASFLPANVSEALSRVSGEKQSKKTRKQRLSAQNPFRVNSPINKPVILVDDIYTTGTTLRHAAAILKKQGCPTVSSYTLVRG